ncbi:A.superbus venom factor 1-like [Mantella aurantiaca]
MGCRALCLVLLGLLAGSTYAQSCTLITSSVLRMDSEETFLVDGHGTEFDGYIIVYDFPKKNNIIAEVSISVNSGNGFLETTKLLVPSTYLDKNPEKKQFVYVTVTSGPCKLEKVVLVSYQNGYIFIQTDKPIYTSGSQVLFRAYSMTQDLKPKTKPMVIEILTPDNVIVKRDVIFQQSIKGMITHAHKLTNFASLGVWTVVARFEENIIHNYTTHFEVREYVLPSFEVKIKVDQKFYYIKDEEFRVQIQANYLNGKPIAGMAYVFFSVTKDGEKQSLPRTLRRIPILDGEGSTALRREDLMKHFQQERDMLQWRLSVSATVIKDSGNDMVKTELTDIHIVTSPYKVLFTKTSKFFKPGFPMDLMVFVTNPDGTPAYRVPVVVEPGTVRGVTLTDGMARLTINIRSDISSIDITVTTADPVLLPTRQASASITATAYRPLGGNYLHLSIGGGELRVGESALVNFLIQNTNPAIQNQITHFNYIILNKGRIMRTGRQERAPGQILVTLPLPITPEFIPSFRLLAYYVVPNGASHEIVADSVWIDVKDTCMGTLTVSSDWDQNDRVLYPGAAMKLRVKADHRASVGLVAVDRGLYMLNDKYKMSQTKVWNTVEKYDTGCTAGGGADAAGVFYDAGLALGNSFHGSTPQRSESLCQGKLKRRRRDTSFHVLRVGYLAQQKLWGVMEAGGASSSQSSQPPPDPMSGLPASGPSNGNLAAAGKGESASAVRERVVSGIKHLNRERDLLVMLRAEVRNLRRQRAALHSNKRSTMDEEVQLANLRVQNQAAVIAMLEESPARMEQLAFTGEDIPENVPDRVKPRKLRVSDKAVFVPFCDVSNDLTICEENSLPCDEALQEKSILQSDILTDELQSPAEPINPLSADCIIQAIAGSADTAPTECCSIVQQQEGSGAALVAEPACAAPAVRSSMVQQQEGGGAALVAKPACAASAVKSSMVQQQDTSSTALGETVSLEVSMDMAGANNVAGKSSVKVVNSPASSAVGSVSVWGIDGGAPTFAQVVSSAPGNVTKPGRQLQRGSASRQAVPPQATATTRASRPSMAPFPFGDEDDYIEDSEISSRTEFPESWLWRIETMYEKPDANGISSKSLTIFLKDSITTWEVLAVSLSENKGICVSNPYNIQVMMSFFIDLQLPYAVFRNEQVEIRAILYNYGNSDLRVRVEWTYNEEFCSLSTAESKYRQFVTVKASSSLAIPYVIIPLTLGDHEVEVKAAGMFISDGVKKNLKVVPEGRLLVQTLSNVVLDPEGKGRAGVQEELIKTVDIRKIVPNTKVETIVTVQGTTVNQLVENVIDGANLNHLITAPYGNGEKIMMTLTPTFIVTHYLDSTGQWEQIGINRRTEAIQHINNGFLNELAFRKPDASYGAWISSPSSTWLTAYVVKVFALAQELIEIDKSVLCDAVKWLIFGKQKPDGSFVENHPVVQQNMVGGITRGAVELDSTLTAFVLIAILESKKSCAEHLNILEISINRAIEYIQQQYPSLRKPYSIAITSYALARAGQLENIDKLMSASTGNNHWEEPGSSHVSLEATSYGLLALVKMEEYEKAGQVVRWLTEQRFHGNTESTQSTIMMFQSMAQYYLDVPLHKDLDMDVSFTLPGKSSRTRIRLTNQNALNARSVNTEGFGNFVVTATGKGQGALSVFSVYYALETETTKQCKNFDLSLKVQDEPLAKRPEGTLSTVSLTICTRYLKSQDAGMSILQVSMMTGFSADIDDLNKLKRGVDRYVSNFEINKNAFDQSTLVLYIDRISHTEDVCLKFNLHQYFKVGRIQPASVTVYDYYSPENRCTKFYHVDENSNLLGKICQGEVCRCAERCFMQQQLEEVDANTRLVSACEVDVDYVYKTTLSEIKEENNYFTYVMTITLIIKEGSDYVQVNQKRNFISHAKCSKALNLQVGRNYMVWGTLKDLLKLDSGYSYIVTKDTWIEMWPNVRECQQAEYETVCDELSYEQVLVTTVAHGVKIQLCSPIVPELHPVLGNKDPHRQAPSLPCNASRVSTFVGVAITQLCQQSTGARGQEVAFSHREKDILDYFKSITKSST